MKLKSAKARIGQTAMAWMVAIFVSLSSSVWAQSDSDGLDEEGFKDTVEGPFDGLNLKAHRIWINDTVYILDRSVRVKGTSTKLGLITDLKQGEPVKARLSPNDETPSIPYVIFIERQ